MTNYNQLLTLDLEQNPKVDSMDTNWRGALDSKEVVPQDSHRPEEYTTKFRGFCLGGTSFVFYETENNGQKHPVYHNKGKRKL